MIKITRLWLLGIAITITYITAKAVGWQQGHALGIRQPEHAGVWQDLTAIAFIALVWITILWVENEHPAADQLDIELFAKTLHKVALA